MNLRVVFHPEAEDELQDATRHYEIERPGIGQTPLEDLELAIGQIIQYPESAPLVSRLVRREGYGDFPTTSCA